MDWKRLEIGQPPLIWSHILLAPALVTGLFLLLALSAIAQGPAPTRANTPTQLSQNVELVGQIGGATRAVAISGTLAMWARGRAWSF